MNDDAARQVALVTGATDGIGRLTAERLAKRGVTVLVHGRSRQKVDDVVASIREQEGDARGLLADLASVEQVRTLSQHTLEAAPRLDILINNAGVGDPGGPRRESEDGCELHFAVNTRAPVLLTRLLEDRLAETAERFGGARVVMVASAAQSPVDFEDPMLEGDYDGMRAYGQSKLALIMATVELAAQLEPERVTVNALHPGTLLDTRMVREGFGRALGPADAGAEAEEHLATSAELASVTGVYFDRFEPAAPHDQAGDDRARRRLMELIDAWC